MGGDHPDGPFTSPEAFLRNATEKIATGIKQLLRYEDADWILVINVQSPDGIFIDDIRSSGGTIDCVPPGVLDWPDRPPRISRVLRRRPRR